MSTTEPRLLCVEVVADLPVLRASLQSLQLPATLDRHFPAPLHWILRFACVQGRFWESACDLVIQIGRQIPEVEKPSPHLGQRRQQRVDLSVDFDHTNADTLQ